MPKYDKKSDYFLLSMDFYLKLYLNYIIAVIKTFLPRFKLSY